MSSFSYQEDIWYVSILWQIVTVSSRIFINANINSVNEASLLFLVLAVDSLGHRSFLNNHKSQHCVVWV